MPETPPARTSTPHTCYCCVRPLPLDASHFHLHVIGKFNRTGYQGLCKPCSADVTAWNRWRRMASTRQGGKRVAYFCGLLARHRRAAALLEIFLAKLAAGADPGPLKVADHPELLADRPEASR